MNQTDWSRARQLFEQATLRPAGERERFLEKACGSDRELFAVVRDLLMFESGADDFLDQPLVDRLIGSAPAAADAIHLPHGSCLKDRYEIERKLTEGGFASVYLARDRHLHGKPVVVKLLDRATSGGIAGLHHMERELRSLAAVNHPSVVGVLDFGTLPGGASYLVMQYVPGVTLRDLIASGPLPLRRAVGLIGQICHALSIAHAAGVWHLDLKPDNIIVSDAGSPDERATIIDFGIARLTGTPERLALIGGSRLYMAPEQRAGNPRRESDIYALGAIASELLTGSAPDAPDRAPAQISGALRNAVRKALAPDPSDRFAGPADFARALEDGIARRDRTRRMAAVAGIAAVALLLSWLGWRQAGTRTRLMNPVPLTSMAGLESFPDLSPDGKRVYFSWKPDIWSQFDIFVSEDGRFEPRRLTSHPAAEERVSVSPDGSRIAFMRGVRPDVSHLITMPAAGGAERFVMEGRFHSIRWWDQRTLLASIALDGQSRIVLIDEQTGLSRELIRPADGYRGDIWPALSNDGTKLAFVRYRTRETSELRVVDVTSKESLASGGRTLTVLGERIESPVWTPENEHILFAMGSLGALSLWRIAADGSGVAEAIPECGIGINAPAIARNAWKLAFSQDNEDSNVWEYILTGPGGSIASERRLIHSTVLDEEGRYSPDGRSIAFLSRRSGSLQVWLSDNNGGNLHKATDLPSLDDGRFAWLPGDDLLAVSVAQSAKGQAAFVLDPRRGRVERQLTGLVEEVSSISRDGEWIYFRSLRSGTNEIWKASRTTGESRQVTIRGGGHAVESVDGKTLFYCKRHEDDGIWQMPVNGGVETQIAGPLARRNMMAVGAHGVYYLAKHVPPRLMFYRFSDKRHILLKSIEKYPGWGIDLSPAGDRLLIGLFDTRDSDVKVVSNFH